MIQLNNYCKWIKPIATLFTLLILIWFLPTSPVDPWNILYPKKFATMIFALVLIQVLGSTMSHLIGQKAGTILSGFLKGLVSSTATTATLARASHNTREDKGQIEILTFLSATGAMLFEGVSLLLIGTNQTHLSLLFIFFGPIIATIIMLFFQSHKVSSKDLIPAEAPFEIMPVLKISLFILTILGLSKFLQIYSSGNGFLILTFIVSLLEIHGSIIANIQLHNSDVFNVHFLGHLLTISILASCLSKLFLVLALGRPSLKKQVTKCSIFLFLSLLCSWFFFVFI